MLEVRLEPHPSNVVEGVVEELLFDKEMSLAVAGTAIEREWMSETGLQPFESDADILAAAHRGELVRVFEGIGYVATQKLGRWDESRSSPDHPLHYSPPFLRPIAAQTLGYIAHTWARRLDWNYRLPATSFSRSIPYQGGLNQRGKLAIDLDIGDSTHLYGFAFDIDACGMYIPRSRYIPVPKQDDPDAAFNRFYKHFTAANPRMNQDYQAGANIGREVLGEILVELSDKGQINFIEEYAGTTNNCFHIAVNPFAFGFTPVSKQANY